MTKSVVRKPVKALALMLAAIIAVCFCLTGCSLFGDSDEGEESGYTVIFYTFGGSNVPSQRVEEGDTVAIPSTPTKAGMLFDGWYADAELTTPWNFNNDVVTESITLFAKWKPDPSGNSGGETTYTVTFHANNGTDATQTLTTDTSGYLTQGAPTFTYAGHSFNGWYDSATGGRLVSATNLFDQKFTASTHVYAHWTSSGSGGEGSETTYTVTFHANNGTDATQALTTNTSGYLTQGAPTFTYAGHTFGGWYDSASGGRLVSATNSFTQQFTASTHLYAHWTSNGGIIGTGDEVTVTFNVGLDARKSGLSNPPAQKVKGGSTVTQPTVTRNGYTVSGWYKEDSGSTAWNFATDTVTENMTLFARWKTGGGSSSGSSYTPSMTNNGVLYIHYLRSASDYDGWCLWVWPTGGAGTRYTSTTVDKSGAVYAIKLSDIGTPAQVNFKAAIISDAGNWGTEDGGDCTVTVSNAMKVNGSYHWFVREGSTSRGSNQFVESSSSDAVTEPLRASEGDVNRSYAANLPIANTVTTCDEMGVGYQIFVASFCDSNNDGVGDIRGIINKLDYLQSLNVDVLWLTPIQSSNTYHGYDCYDYYSIDPKFGTNADYRELVYKSHQKGMKVIMDLVVNHTSPNNEWFIKSKQGVVETVTYQDGTTAEVKYRDFYRWSNSGGNRKYNGGNGWYFYSSFGSNMPELNYDCQAVRDAMGDVAAYWMNFGLDGFRMDAIKHVFMSDESQNGSSDVITGDSGWSYNLTKNTEFFKEFNYNLKAKYPHCFLLGEQLDGNANNVAPFYQGMDSLFDFHMYYNLPGKIKDGDAGSSANSFNYNAQIYAQNRNGRPINSMISSNHDIPRLSSLFSSESQIKLYFAVMMTLPGLSWIYYGDEIALAGPGGGSDAAYRQSMKWTSDWENECHNDISAKNLNGSTVSVAEQSTNSNSLLSYVRKLTKLRNDNPVLINGTATCSTQDGMLKITVTGGGKTLTVYHNFTGSQKTVSGTTVFGENTVPAYGTTVVK